MAGLHPVNLYNLMHGTAGRGRGPGNSGSSFMAGVGEQARRVASLVKGKAGSATSSSGSGPGARGGGKDPGGYLSA